jgi:pimeloyl-ACP methyl ester carboxylesterase
MWALTTKSMLATDVVAAVRELERRHDGKRVILAGHSSGGGLTQLALSPPKCDVKAAGLALVATIPPFGSLRVYANWFRLDPWFMIRSLMHLQHPRSPLSSPSLVKGAFFGERMATQDVKEFETWMPEYESLAWPVGMMWKFVDTARVASAIVGWGRGRGHTRVLIIAGGEDKLISLEIMQRVAEEYRLAVRGMEGRKKIEGTRQRVSDSSMDKGVIGVVEQRKDGVTLAVIEGAGH